MKNIEEFDSNKFRVMAVDDSLQNLKLIRSVLRNHGYRVSISLSVGTFFERLQKMKPDLILLDIFMPDMCGLDICERLKTDCETRDIPVIFLSSNCESDLIVDAFNLGAVDYVSLPIKVPELLARVRSHLELSRSCDRLRKENEELLAMNDRKVEFMGIASHDLKNPLASIVGMSQLLSASPSMPFEEVHKWVVEISNQSERMIHIIKNLIDANRLDGGIKVDFSIFDLKSIVLDVCRQQRLAAEMKDQLIRLNLPDEELLVNVDFLLMTQVLENLLSNAIKYSPIGKGITVSAERKNGKVLLKVMDEGPGLSREDQQKLFKRFSKLNPNPTGGEHSSGLGLSIVKRLVQEMSGNVWCRSVLGKGSVFGVTLDYAESDRQSLELARVVRHWQA